MNQHDYMVVHEGTEAPEFIGDLNFPTPIDINKALDSFDYSGLGPPPPLYASPTIRTPAFASPMNTFMQPTSGSGHSTRDAVVGIAQQGLDFLSKFYATKNPAFASQVGYAPSGGVGTYAADPGTQAGGAVGSGVGSLFDGIINWVKQNTLLAAGLGIGAFLLFKDPPRRR